MSEAASSIYDYPKYYDLVYGSDWQAEYEFLSHCFEIYPDVDVKHVFEPACGTGRLLYRFGKRGYSISGLDLNEKAIDFCNERLEKHGMPRSTFVADMCQFQLETKCDAAFNMVNSFRHVNTAEESKAHFQCMRDALNVGGIYVLGLHLLPLEGDTIDREAWSASRGHLTVNTSMWLVERNEKQRYEDYALQFDIYTPTDFQHLENIVRFRTYTANQFTNQIDEIEGLEIDCVHDFGYDIDEPIGLDSSVEDAVFIIKRTH